MLSYEDVKLICEKNESFKMKHQVFGNTVVAQCTYFLASAGDFFDAHNDGSMIRATELRGITFVKEGEGEWKRYLFLDKFFNVNQTNGTDATFMNLTLNGKTEKVNINKLYVTVDEKTYRAIDLKVGMTVGEFDRATETVVGEFFVIKTLESEVLAPEYRENSWMYDDIKDLEVVRVANKDDGSCIRFLILNGELVAKTKFSLEAEQTAMAMEVVNADANLKAFIYKTLELGLAALFEIVSPFNKVVLSYNETSLKLLQLRVEETGEYLDIYNHPLVAEYGLVTADQEPLHSLDEMFKMAGEIENKEGWVVTFANGKMAKVKTAWYMNLHGLLTDGLKENKLVSKILNEEIDDVLAFIPVDAVEEREFINELTAVIVAHVNSVATKVFNTFNAEYKGDRKEFALKFRSDPLFSFMTMLFKENTYEYVEKAVAKKVIFDCRKLEMARTYVKNLGFTRELKLLEDDN
jgi:T4 RnlA family RNA ligase